MNISPAHLHLILNHIPIIGTGFVAVMLFIAIAYRNFFMEKVSLLFLVAIALTTAIVFKTGDGTAAAVQNCLACRTIDSGARQRRSYRAGFDVHYWLRLAWWPSLFQKKRQIAAHVRFCRLCADRHQYGRLYLDRLSRRSDYAP